MAVKKRSSSSALPKAKKLRTLGELPWKSTKISDLVSGDDGILELEEVDDVEVVYEENPEGGRVAKFKTTQNSSTDHIAQADSASDDGYSEEDEVDSDSPAADFGDLANWTNFGLHPRLLDSIRRLGFIEPTPIQAQTLAYTLKGRDVVGVAQTGSGKTLAYGLPALNYLFSQKRSARKKRQVSGLILAPTRELALQIVDHLKACVPPVAHSEDSKKVAPLVSIAALIGGLSAQKQKRILQRGADIIVATPGRLWDILQEDEVLADQIKRLRFVILDEADRMIQNGHYEELDKILLVPRRQIAVTEDNASDDGEEEPPADGLQTFVFSATLSKDLQINLSKRRSKYHDKKPKASTLDDLLLRLDFRDPEPAVVDLSPEGGVVNTLRESRIECLNEEKDFYLYYFVLRYPGRTIVFFSSIDGIRRVSPLFLTLGLKAFPLHSQMEQRQRLKNLDRFKSTPNAILLATDIAARGLDIELVDHVIHYQPPRSADAYIHRVGRTARAGNEGFSLGLIGPSERKSWIACITAVGRDKTDIAPLDVPLSVLDKLKERVALARQIEKAQHEVQKRNHDRGWLEEAAQALEVDLDDFEEDESKDRVRKQAQAKQAALKSQLAAMLAKPILAATGVAKSYITHGTVPLVDSLLSSFNSESQITGLKQGGPAEHRLKVKVRGKTKASAKPIEAEDEEAPEWHGFGT